MDALWQDLLSAFRALRARPAFAALATLTLAGGIGAVTAIFSVVHAVLLRQLPYRDPDAVVFVEIDRTDGDTEPLSILDLEDFQTARGIALVGYSDSGVNLTGDGDPERLTWSRTANGFFQLLGARPALGRLFTDGDAREPVVVLGDALWRRRFAADPAIVGRGIALNGQRHTVIGVLPPGFVFPNPRIDLAAPLDLATEPRRPRRDAGFLRAIGRIATDRAGAEAELDAIAARLQREFPVENGRKRGLVLTPIADQLVGRFRGMLALLLGAVGAVLLIACANLAGLLLVQGAGRRRELAVRAAVGASAGRLARQLLLESLLLSLAGGALGLAVARWGVDALLAISPAQIPRLREAGLDGQVLGFALLLSVATAVVFGLAPALRAARIDPGAALAEGRTGLAPAAARARRVLVAGEVALSLALLCVAGLLLQGFARLQGTRPGFDPARALTFRVQLPPQRYADRGSVVRFQQALREGLRALPGVLEAGSTQILPLGTSLSTIDFTVEGRPPPSSESVPQAHYRLLSPATLAALGIPLIEGRDLGPSDGSEAPPVAVVNRRLAERHGVGVGTRLLLDDLGAKPRPVTIVGIAADVREAGLDRDPLVMIYVPLAQAPESALIYGRNMFWIARTAGDPLASTTAAIGAVRAIDASLPVASVQSLEQVVAVSLAPRRFNLLLVAVFASAALLLSALGIYALASQLAAARRRELGIRLALGATPASLLRFALLDGMRPVLAGLALGAVASLVVSRLAGDLLGGLPPAPMVAAAAAALVAAALAAVWFPARRAARTDAAVVMRE